MAVGSGGAVMTREQYIDLFSGRLAFMDEILFENFDAPSLTYPSVFNVRDSVRAYEEVTGITGFSQFPVKPEGEKVEYDSLLAGFNKRFTHITYSKGYQISMEAMEDDIDGAITDAAPALSRVARNSIETLLYNVWNNGFGTELTPDGVSLFNGSHVLVGGGTADNLVAADITQTGVEEAVNLFDNMRDDRNQLIQGDPQTLMCSPSDRWLVHETLKSQLMPGLANAGRNDDNALNQIGLNVLINKYITNIDDWFLFSDPSQHRVLCYWRKDPVTDHTLDFETGNMKSKMTYRLSAGAADWRNTVGGKGQT